MLFSAGDLCSVVCRHVVAFRTNESFHSSLKRVYLHLAGFFRMLLFPEIPFKPHIKRRRHQMLDISI